MVQSEKEKLREMHLQVFILKGIVNACEVCTSALTDGFLDDVDLAETQKTITRIQYELLELDPKIVDKLNGGFLRQVCKVIKEEPPMMGRLST